MATISPWLKIKNTEFAPVTKLASLDPISQMADQGEPIDEEALKAQMGAMTMTTPTPEPVTPVMPVMRQRTPSQSAPMPITSISESYKTTSAAPGIAEQADMYRRQIDELQMQNQEKMQPGIEDYQKKIDEYEKSSRVDWRPLAGLIDQWSGGGNLLKVADALAPEPPELKKEKLQAMREKLQGMKGSMSKQQLDYLKDNLDSLKAQMNAETAEKRLQASFEKQGETQGRLKERDIEKDVQEYEKRIRDRQKILNNYGPIEQSLGFDIESFDENTGTVNGQRVDTPGFKIPGLQKAYALTPEGERFRTRFQSLLNDTLRAYSGAAVTDSEAAKTLSRFAINPGAVREDVFLTALKDFKRMLREEVAQTGAAFRPEVRETYESRFEAIKPKETQSPQGGAGLSPEKAKRLEELRKKLGK